MIFSLTTFSLLFFLVPHVSSSAIPSSQLRHLLIRQGSIGIDPADLPPQCQTICGPFIATANQCTTGATDDTTCGCTDQTITDLVSCINCLVGFDPVSFSATRGQEVVNNFVDVCEAAGVDLQPGTVTGGEGGNSTSTSTTTSGTTTSTTSSSSSATTKTSSSSSQTTTSSTTKPAGASGSSDAPKPSQSGAAKVQHQLKWGALVAGAGSALVLLI